MIEYTVYLTPQMLAYHQAKLEATPEADRDLVQNQVMGYLFQMAEQAESSGKPVIAYAPNENMSVKHDDRLVAFKVRQNSPTSSKTSLCMKLVGYNQPL